MTGPAAQRVIGDQPKSLIRENAVSLDTWRECSAIHNSDARNSL